ncbi:MAG: tetratricopeptide repeat protein [Chitinophagales bacterium]|jgi:tetratricopeptide (TPR) repeat protein
MAKKYQIPVKKTTTASLSEPTTGNSLLEWLPVLVAFLVFSLALGNEMTGVDDHASTVENPAVKDFSLKTLFTNFNLGMYAPLTWLAYAMAYGLGEDNAVLYHLLSLVVHTINTRLVFLMLKKLDVATSLLLPISLLFAIHPIQVESVAWIAGFSTPLFSLFSLLSFNFYLDYSGREENRTRNYILALVFFILACLAKSAAVTVPLTLVVLDWWRKPTNLGLIKKWSGYVPFFLGALGFGLLTIYTREVSGTMVGATGNGYTALERVLLVCYAPLFYISKMLVPLKLSIYYSFDKINGVLPWTYYMAPFGVLSLAVLGWRTRQSAPYIYTGLLFFLSNVIITLPFATLGTFELCADHYNYIAAIGIFYILVKTWQALQQRFPERAGLLRTVGWVWFIAIMVLCVRQIRIWKDTITVISNAIENGYYHNGMMFMGRGIEFGDNGKMQDAMKDFTKALELNPEIRDAYKFRGSIYAQSGQVDLALKDLEKYLSYDSTDVVTWNNVAMIYMRQGKLPKAIEAFTTTIGLKPDAAISYQNRAKVYEMMGNTALAQADLKQANEILAQKRQQKAAENGK